MEWKQSTFEEIVETEKRLVLDAEARYGNYYLNARECSIFLSRSIASVELSHHETFGRFFSQLKKYHMLALLSTLRLHKVQSMLNLRQVIGTETPPSILLSFQNREASSPRTIVTYANACCHRRMGDLGIGWTPVLHRQTA